MKRIVILLLLFSVAYADETIPFTDGNMLALGPSLIVRPEIIVHNTIINEKTFFTVNISNPGTVSFPQITFYANDSTIQRQTGQLSLKKQEAKKFNLSAEINSAGIFITEIVFKGYETKATSTVFILSSQNKELPELILQVKKLNTLETLNTEIKIPKNQSGTLFYGFVDLEGELIGINQEEVAGGEDKTISIKIPKEITPGKYLFFTSINQETFTGEIIEITTFIPIQTLIIMGLVIIGLGALIQTGRLRKKEKTLIQ